MNKKEVAHIRKQFKLDNHLMHIYDILNVYINEGNERNLSLGAESLWVSGPGESQVDLSRNDKPLYIQIKNIIKERILHSVYPLGEVIPSEPQLEQEFAVSKITVRSAIQELPLEGYVEKGSGRGTKVIRNSTASKLSKWKHFTEILLEQGHRIEKNGSAPRSFRTTRTANPTVCSVSSACV